MKRIEKRNQNFFPLHPDGDEFVLHKKFIWNLLEKFRIKIQEFRFKKRESHLERQHFDEAFFINKPLIQKYITYFSLPAGSLRPLQVLYAIYARVQPARFPA